MEQAWYQLKCHPLSWWLNRTLMRHSPLLMLYSHHCLWFSNLDVEPLSNWIDKRPTRVSTYSLPTWHLMCILSSVPKIRWSVPFFVARALSPFPTLIGSSISCKSVIPSSIYPIWVDAPLSQTHVFLLKSPLTKTKNYLKNKVGVVYLYIIRTIYSYTCTRNTSRWRSRDAHRVNWKS